MIELLFGRKTPTQITNPTLGLLQLDATLSEGQEFNVRWTSFPVESGATMSDHAIREPEEVTIEGLITATPVQILGNLRNQLTSGGDFRDPVGDGYAFLLSICGYQGYTYSSAADKMKTLANMEALAAGNKPDTTEGPQVYQIQGAVQLVDIISEFRAYTNMGLARLSVHRDKDTGDSLKFTASFKKINLVDVGVLAAPQDTASASVPRAKEQSAKPKDLGSQNAAKTPLKSAPKIALDWLKSKVAQ